MKRILALILAVLMMATVFVGCTETAKEGEGDGEKAAATALEPEAGATLVVWAPDKAVKLVESQCEAFKALYPDANMTITVKAQGEGDAGTNLLNDAAKGADVFGFACDQLNQLVSAEVILPVNANLVEDVKTRNSELSVNAATMNDMLYAFPETGDNGYYLVYDKSVLSEDDVKTMEGILAACKKAGKKFILNAGDGFYGCMFPFTGGLETAGIDEDGVTQLFNEYNEDEIVEVLVAFAELFHEYEGTFVNDNPNKIAAGFNADPTTVAAGIDGSWNAKADEKALGENLGAAKLPTINVNGEDKQIVSMHGYKCIGVNSYTKYPVAATLLADYLTNEECQLQRAEELYWGPSNIKAAESDAVKNNPVIPAILEQAEFSVAQVEIVKPFWNPMGTLGAKLCDPKEKYDEDTIRALFQETMINIKDE